MHILIVEDDENIAKMIETCLDIAAYETTVCSDGNEALSTICANNFDLILLDVMLPGMDGFEIMEHIQSREIPVIFLSALENVCDKVKGLRLGGEDYIVKPFEPMELLTRIEVVLRRVNKGQHILTFEDITVDLDKHIARKNGREVKLTPKEFDTLVFFIQNADIALTRERLLASIWGYTYEGESRTVDVHVQQVRKKMGLQGALKSIPKLGYRLERRRDEETL